VIDDRRIKVDFSQSTRGGPGRWASRRVAPTKATTYVPRAQVASTQPQAKRSTNVAEAAIKPAHQAPQPAATSELEEPVVATRARMDTDSSDDEESDDNDDGPKSSGAAKAAASKDSDNETDSDGKRDKSSKKHKKKKKHKSKHHKHHHKRHRHHHDDD